MTFGSAVRLLSVFVEQPPLQPVGAAPRLGVFLEFLRPQHAQTDPVKLIATFGVPTDIAVTICVNFIILPSHQASVVLSFAT
jgi:hypothetical protein